MYIEQTSPSALEDDAHMFDLAPVSLWLEDASDVKILFHEWAAAGMTSLREWLAKPDCMAACLARLRLIKVNRKTLDLFEADSLSHFTDNLHNVVTPHSLESMVEEFSQLWEGQTKFFGKTINMTLTGRVLDVQVRGNLLPGYESSWGRVLVAVEDVTDLQTARRAMALSESYARGLFEHSPISIWVKDFSAVKGLLDEVRDAGVVDLRQYLDHDPQFARHCIDAVRVIDINRQALRLLGAKDKDSFLGDLSHVVHPAQTEDLKTLIIGLWEGHLFQQCDVVSQTLDGRHFHAQLQLSVFPGHETDWAKVQVARIDISERKKAEAHLKYVGTHDPITGLYNRSFFVDKFEELEAACPHPVTVIMVDLNGLKGVNDNSGHAAGDDMLRRAARILADVATDDVYAARIGGDEFALVMPRADEADGKSMMQVIQNLIDIHNQISDKHPLSFSMGSATRHLNERIESVVSRADAAMYDNKQLFYAPRLSAPSQIQREIGACRSSQPLLRGWTGGSDRA